MRHPQPSQSRAIAVPSPSQCTPTPRGSIFRTAWRRASIWAIGLEAPAALRSSLPCGGSLAEPWPGLVWSPTRTPPRIEKAAITYMFLSLRCELANARRSQCLESRDGLCARSRYGSQVFQGVSCPRALRAMLRAVRARVSCLCWVHYSARAYLGFHALCFPARDFGVRRLQACRAWPGVARRRLGRRLQDRRSRMLYAAGSCRR